MCSKLLSIPGAELGVVAGDELALRWSHRDRHLNRHLKYLVMRSTIEAWTVCSGSTMEMEGREEVVASCHLSGRFMQSPFNTHTLGSSQSSSSSHVRGLTPENHQVHFIDENKG
jgi:hypothetical protein